MDSTPRFTRRYALKLIGDTALAIPVGLAVPQLASAGRGWCRTDPVIELRNPQDTKGNNASIYLSAFAEEMEFNNSSIDVVVEHPKDAKTNKQWEDKSGYFGQGLSCNFAPNTKLKFYSTGMDVRVTCYVPASRNDMKITLEWAPGPLSWDANGDPLPATVIASATGYANRWITLQSKLNYAKYR